MRLQTTFALSLLLGMLICAGCYTQIGYHAASDFDRRYHKVLADKRAEAETEAEVEKAEPEHPNSEASEADDGYYGRRKYTRRSTYVSPYNYNYYGRYWGPYSYYYAPVVPYYPHPWYYGYGYYGYAYPYYYPYTNVYRRYYGGPRYYPPVSRRTYTPHPQHRRSRSSRSVTSPQPRSERPQRGTRGRNGR